MGHAVPCLHLLLQNRTWERWSQARSAFGVINNGLIKTLRQVGISLHSRSCLQLQ
jgi:hypothetical protein